MALWQYIVHGSVSVPHTDKRNQVTMVKTWQRFAVDLMSNHRVIDQQGYVFIL